MVVKADFTKPKPSNWRQVFALLSVSLSSLTSGILLNWPSPSFPILESKDYPYPISREEASYIALIHPLFISLFGPISGKLIDLLGRRYTLMFITLPHTLTWVITSLEGPVWMYYIAKVFNGLGDSCSISIVTVYIMEVCTPEVRKSWANVQTFFFYSGNIIMNVVGSYFGIRTAALILMCVPITLFLLTLILPESPYYALMKNRTEQARKSLKWLRNKDDVEDELKQLTADVQRQMSESSLWKDVWNIKSNRRSVLLGLFLRGMQVFSGFTAISMYCKTIFLNTGAEMSATASAVIVSCVVLICIVLNTIFLKSLRKKLQMGISSFGSAICLTIFGLSLHYNFEVNYLPLTFMILYIAFFTMGLATIPIVMMGEIYSNSIKSKAFCLMNLSLGLYTTLANQAFSYLMFNFGLAAPFLFFAVLCAVGGVISLMYVPETTGKTLEEIQQMFKK